MVQENLDKFTEEVKKISSWDDASDFENNYENDFKDTLKNVKKEDWEGVDRFVTSCIETGIGRVLEFAEWILEKRKIIEWKKHPQMIERWLEKVEELGQIPESDNSDLYSSSDFSGFMEKTVKVIKTNQMMKQFQSQLHQIAMTSLKTDENRLHLACISIVTELPWDNIAGCIELLDKTYGVVQQYPEISTKHLLAVVVTTPWLLIFSKYIQKPNEAKAFVKYVSPVFTFCKDQEWIDADDADERTLSHALLKVTMESFLMPHHGQTEIIKPFMPVVKELWKCDDEELESNANTIITMAGSSAQELLGDDTTDELIEQYLKGEQLSLMAQFGQMYPKYPDKFNSRIDEFVEAMQGREMWVCQTTMNLFWLISKSNPQAFSKQSIAAIASKLSNSDNATLGLLCLSSISEKRPHDIEPHEDLIIQCMKSNPTMATQGGNILANLSGISEKKARKYLKVLHDLVKISDSANASALMYNMRKIGGQYTDALAEYEEFFKTLKENPALQDHAQGILDIIAGRTLEGISQEMAEQREDIENLEERVTTTEDNVTNLGKEVDNTVVVVHGIREDVNEQETRLTEVEEVVEETVEKVEEIDKKTLSHAPSWSRDVARLLNPQAEHDWRYLASRLNYKNDDIRNWATQPDPCLSLMDEWFATHKTKEATFAVLTALQEMNREDAAMIVENALKRVEDIVEDEEADYVTPPSVFISYQWGLQNEVKLLKNHLEMAGFTCWMDIGQMGGGDKLFEKIDKGIRAAEVVVCCVSDKYAKSPNCNREVNLSVNLGKPIIPLLMEKMSWPPPGSMGPIFGEYLFIRFFARSGETAGDERYWPTAKFQELLMQLRYHAVPDHTMISDLYKDWWQPPEEVITIKPRDESTTVQTSKDNEIQKGNVEPSTPDVFISYQWGKQPQIKVLYKTLVSHGYTCWLDIMQMGGGDSLYDKIDRGIRGCKVVLTCVTGKYALSPNCRREVSLADALKKPIVPLLLEKITWPPEGPMSMVFTQLLYIDFCKPDITIQDHWKCSQMDELHNKIQQAIPPDNLQAKAEATEKTGEKMQHKENLLGDKAKAEEATNMQPNNALKTNHEVHVSSHQPETEITNNNDQTLDPKTQTNNERISTPVSVANKSSCCLIQ